MSSIVSFSLLLSACLSYLSSLSVLFIFPLSLSLSLFYSPPLLFSSTLSLLHSLFSCFSLTVTSLSLSYPTLFPSLSLFILFPLSSFHPSLSSLFSSLPLLSDLPPSVSLSPSHFSLYSLYLDLLTRYEQAQELLEMKKLFLLKIIASANPPPPTPEQAQDPSSMKTVSNDGCTKRGRTKLTDKKS